MAEANATFTEKSAIKGETSAPSRYPGCGLFQKIPKRYVLAVVAFLGFACAYSMRVNLSLGIVAMTESHMIHINGTNVTVAQFDWSPRMQGIILSSFFWGYIFTHLPGGWLAAKYGGKQLLGISVFGSAILTILTPPLCQISVYLIIAVRVMEGLLQGFLYPSIHALWANWAPPLEKTKLSTIAFSGSFFGTVVTLPLCGVIIDSIGWVWVFYIFGIVSIVWFVFWLFLVADTPLEHPSITREELEYIRQTAGYIDVDSESAVKSVPWKSILTSVHVWAIAVAHFAENWGFYTMLTELPTYLHQVMKYDVYKAGIMSAIPYLVMCIMIQVGGQLADLVRSRHLLSTTNTRKVFNCSGFVLQAILMITSAFVTTPAAAISCISFAVGFGGLAWSGFSVNPLDLAPQYASIVFGLSNTLASLSGILSPGFAGMVTPHETQEEWRIVFFVAAAILCLGTFFFAAFASGDLQPWGQRSMLYDLHADEKDVEAEDES